MKLYEVTLNGGWDETGIAFTENEKVKNQLFIANIDPSGEAFNFTSEKGGIRVGDILYAVNDKKVKFITTMT